jgi:hypothetical protein
MKSVISLAAVGGEYTDPLPSPKLLVVLDVPGSPGMIS